jgi:three-Cys-motif partner protein
MGRDLHQPPFDEGTKVKLALYGNYVQEWLPVFLTKTTPIYKVVNIFDFFAGPGCDVNGEKGSPLITLEAVAPYFDSIVEKGLNVHLYFNELAKWKLEELKVTVSELALEEKPVHIRFSDYEFQKAFSLYYPLMRKDNSANFLFLDQSGVKQITDEVFSSMIDLPTTDFLFFISSSTTHRFCEHPRIKKHIRIPKTKVSNTEYVHIHRIVIDYYRSLVPSHKEYHLAPFTIKKGSNVYGLIFGTGNLLGMDKFLRTCWKIDPQRGEANFDIDEDGIDQDQPSLFADMNKPKKVKVFEQRLAEHILMRKLQTNRDIYCFTLCEGFLPLHARNVISNLVTQKQLPKQRIPISYTSCKTGVFPYQVRCK